MSFIITLYVREGIVMASDSRLTLNTTEEEEEGKKIVRLAINQTDTNYKTFLAATANGSRIGISTFGQADVDGVPIAGFLESFINDRLSNAAVDVDEVPLLLLEYFKDLSYLPSTGFHVAGYKTVGEEPEQHAWEVRIDEGKSIRLNRAGVQGAGWAGEADIIARLVCNVAQITENGEYVSMPYHQIQWGYFTLQDAIDFAIYAVRTTIDSIRFQPRPSSVGGPIDVLVIKPGEATWIQRKELHG